MRSSARARWRAVAATAIGFGIVTLACAVAPASAAAGPDEAEVSKALEQVKADPNLSPHRTTRTLKWVDEQERRQYQQPGFLAWLGGLFAGIAGASRIFFWALIIVALGLLGLFIARLAQHFRYEGRPRVADVPTHVRELDIRPESLPRDIGATALQLWERNDHRGALVLLYRGLLSRLVHGHGVPIRESSTEADCVTLAVPRLDAVAATYTAGLVRVWQHAIYGAREPAADEMRTLCTRFDGTFPAPAETADPA
ncbi:MAG TPA: DUF4129 domain-containing protein [Steroidobacteraceae bacterium]|nr:DUF4129 domain-containing protein [Steroidobacteraceae bacterium]